MKVHHVRAIGARARRGSSAFLDRLSEPPGIQPESLQTSRASSATVGQGRSRAIRSLRANPQNHGCPAAAAAARHLGLESALCACPARILRRHIHALPRVGCPAACRILKPATRNEPQLCAPARTRAGVPVPRNLHPYDSTDCVNNTQSVVNLFHMPSVVNAHPAPAPRRTCGARTRADCRPGRPERLTSSTEYGAQSVPTISPLSANNELPIANG